MGFKRRRPLKQLCSCSKLDYRLVWYHELCTHNDHIWTCLTCGFIWIEWKCGYVMSFTYRHDIVKDERDEFWGFAPWSTKVFEWMKHPINESHNFKLSILLRDEDD